MHTVELTCPYCFETVEVWLEPDLEGEMVQDCDVCCRPWLLVVKHDPSGEPQVGITRAQ